MRAVSRANKSLFIVLVLALMVQHASAEVDNNNASSKCKVVVRSIRGFDREVAQGFRRLEVGTFLSDVKNQLESLPYAHYRVVGSQELKLGPGEQGDFALFGDNSEQHKLRVIPHPLVHNRVPITVDWKGPGGDTVVSTKMRVPNGKSMVLGRDSSENSSTIMCVTVDCRDKRLN